MGSNWQEIKKNWARETILSEKICSWAVDSMKSTEKSINSIEEKFLKLEHSQVNDRDIEQQIKELQPEYCNPT